MRNFSLVVCIRTNPAADAFAVHFLVGSILLPRLLRCWRRVLLADREVARMPILLDDTQGQVSYIVLVACSAMCCGGKMT